MKKTTFLMVLMAFMMVSLAYAATDDMQSANITLNFPTNNTYVATTGGTLLKVLNATVFWNSQTNITNVSFVFTSGSTRFVFTNNTVNGTASGAPLSGNFTYTISADNLTPNLVYDVRVEIRNTTTIGNDAAVNSSFAKFGLDSLNPTASLTNPLSGSTVVPTNNIVTFEYTPTDSNFGNCTLHLNNIATKSSTSGTIAANITTATVNRFTQNFGADNNTVRSVIQCIDLAGNIGVSNNFTFNVLLGALSPAVRQAMASGSGYIPAQQPASGKGFTASPPSAYIPSTHLQKYGWLYFVAIAVIGGLLIWKKFK